jgi:hypothetical protein
MVMVKVFPAGTPAMGKLDGALRVVTLVPLPVATQFMP